MSDNKVNGSCFCKKVNYEISGNMGVFQYCHCSRCRKVTGSAHAANLFVAPDDFKWLSGEENVGRYDPPETKYFATSFCKNCGSPLPWLSKSGQVVIVPPGRWMGTRDPANAKYSLRLRSAWYTDASSLPEHEEMPPRK